ncbi:MAG: aspartate aminotransferase family protein [Actinomycetia bacterium]|nr:aspartate aminotransferase family protein [Actinomycetes bacterium]
MTTPEDNLVDRFEATVNPGLARIQRFMGLTAVEAGGFGAEVWDETGQRYLDLGGGYGVFVHGYRHPRIVAAAVRQLEQLPLSSRVLLNRPMVALAEELRALTPGDLQYSFFCNSGAEAVEAALKFARAATGRTHFVAAEGAFHGKTFGALSVSGRRLYREPFEPLLPGVRHVPFGSVEALEAAVGPETAAVVLEPIQGEGGVIVPPPGYLAAARRICDRAGALLIVDEVQTGMGRTGTLFAVEQEEVVPDLMTLAKGLGGGVVPIGAVVGRPGAFRFFEEAPLLHTSTFGGNPLAAAVAREALRVMVEEDLPGQARLKGAWLAGQLDQLARQYPDIIREVRGRGLMLGLELVTAGHAGALMSEMFARHVLAVYTLNNERVIRFMPPLVITEQQLATVVERLADALAAVRAMDLEE